MNQFKRRISFLKNFFDVLARIMEMLREKSWALLDIEFIQSTRDHKCYRKLYILSYDGFTALELDFFPCRTFKDLDRRYKKSFRFCRAHIHKLSYYPEKCASPCSTAVDKVDKFIVDNGIDLILYKGGCIEKHMCKELCIPSLNIEQLGEFERPYSHDPRVEVNTYYTQLIQLS